MPLVTDRRRLSRLGCLVSLNGIDHITASDIDVSSPTPNLAAGAVRRTSAVLSTEVC
jgi:hypothetical protein